MSHKPRLLILSAVHPFPPTSGQQQRVFYKLRALRSAFHITFLTYAAAETCAVVGEKLLVHCDEAIVLPSVYLTNAASRVFHKLMGLFFAVRTGLKPSNYVNGEVEFSTDRLKAVLDDKRFDCVLFEYWHAHKATTYFRERGIPSVLDMHDILWRSYARQWEAKRWSPGWLRNWFVRRYQAREEAAWGDFDMLIAINQEELNYVRRVVSGKAVYFYVPMGTDISTWPHCWQPAHPRRVAYYGGLGSAHNQQDALTCYHEIMPRIWAQYNDTEFWIVGSNPPTRIKELELDKRVHVTGFVEQPQDVLKTMSLAICPWTGTYGFRSRLVELMALGVPVVASQDAVYGMGFDLGKGIFWGNDTTEITRLILPLVSDERKLRNQSLFARQQVEQKFSYEATYGQFSNDLANFLQCRLKKKQH